LGSAVTREPRTEGRSVAESPRPRARRHDAPMGAQHVRDAIPDDPVRTDIRPIRAAPPPWI